MVGAAATTVVAGVDEPDGAVTVGMAAICAEAAVAGCPAGAVAEAAEIPVAGAGAVAACTGAGAGVVAIAAAAVATAG